MPNPRVFARDILFYPSKALERLRSPDAAFKESSILYFLVALGTIAFFALKPADFPELDSTFSAPIANLEGSGLALWLRVGMWEPILLALWILFFAIFAGIFKSPFAALPVQVGLGGILGFLPAIPWALHRKGMLPTFLFAFFWIFLIASFYSLLKGRDRNEWRRLASAIMALSCVDGFLLLPSAISAALRASTLYTGLHYLNLAWTIALGTHLLSKLEKLSKARAFVAFILSLVWQLFFLFFLYSIGLVSKEVLAAMMNA